ncbi:hypothetical protein U1Q18_002509 [Sarracenia purpurea var. burkii]
MELVEAIVWRLSFFFPWLPRGRCCNGLVWPWLGDDASWALALDALAVALPYVLSYASTSDAVMLSVAKMMPQICSYKLLICKCAALSMCFQLLSCDASFASSQCGPGRRHPLGLAVKVYRPRP